LLIDNCSLILPLTSLSLPFYHKFSKSKIADGALAGAYAKRRFRTRRHKVNAALGMPARSACASMANGWQARMPTAVFVPDGTK
jgi:hypothetical protein